MCRKKWQFELQFFFGGSCLLSVEADAGKWTRLSSIKRKRKTRGKGGKRTQKSPFALMSFVKQRKKNEVSESCAFF